MKILIVDDDLDLLGLIAFALRQAGYLVVQAQDGREAISAFEAERPDLVILDVNMPRLDGLEVLKRIREGGHKTPVMLLTVRSSEEDQVRGLDLGADDYLSKPFSPRTLLARVRALLRRAGDEKPSSMSTEDFTIDLESQTVSIKDGPAIRLTSLEVRLLQFLLANSGHPMPTDRLTTHVWGYRGMGDKQLLKQLVHRLRQKIEVDPSEPRYLLTAPGVGYLLQASAKPHA